LNLMIMTKGRLNYLTRICNISLLSTFSTMESTAALSQKQQQQSSSVADGLSLAKAAQLPSFTNSEKHRKWTSDFLRDTLPGLDDNQLKEEAEKALKPSEKLPLKLTNYAHRYSLKRTEEELELQKEIESLPGAAMAGAPDEANLMCLMLELMDAKKVVEVGVFRGITTLAFALCLKRLDERNPKIGRKVIGLDVSDEYAAIGKSYWKKAGVGEYIDFRVGDAKESLDVLIEDMTGKEDLDGGVDLCFIDADKQSYDDYYEKCLKLTKKGGLICVDNTIWGGRVLIPDLVLDAIVEKNNGGAAWKDKADSARGTRAIKELTKKIFNDERIERVSFLTMADGVIICRKK